MRRQEHLRTEIIIAYAVRIRIVVVVVVTSARFLLRLLLARHNGR